MVYHKRVASSSLLPGFQRVGVMRAYERGPDGTFHDGLLLDLLRDELR